MEAEEVFKILSIVFLSMLKFIFGPTLGYAAGFPLWATVTITVVGMMISVILFTYIGDFLRNVLLKNFFKKRRRFSKRNRKFVTVWKKYGILGVAFLTPLLFTPIGGTILLTSFGTKSGKILINMLISALFWAWVISSLIYFLGAEFLPI